MVNEVIGFATVNMLVAGVTAVVIQRCLPWLHCVFVAIISSIVVTAVGLIALLALTDRHGRSGYDLLLESLTDPTSTKVIAGFVFIGALGSAVILWLQEMGRRARELS